MELSLSFDRLLSIIGPAMEPSCSVTIKIEHVIVAVPATRVLKLYGSVDANKKFTIAL